MTLYEITADLQYLQSLFDDEDIDEQTISDTIDSVMFDFENKADGYGTVISVMEGEVETLDREIKRLTAKRDRKKNGIKRLKDTLKENILSIGKRNINGELFKFTVKNNAPQLPKEIPSEMIPDNYYIPQDPKIDRRGLLKAVKDGEIKGITLERSQSLLIK